MRSTQHNDSGGSAKFFRLTLSHEGLLNYFTLNSTLITKYNYSLTEIENMIPWERDTYISLIITQINEENEKIKQKNFRNNQ
jgi:hypothetical protein